MKHLAVFVITIGWFADTTSQAQPPEKEKPSIEDRVHIHEMARIRSQGVYVPTDPVEKLILDYQKVVNPTDTPNFANIEASAKLYSVVGPFVDERKGEIFGFKMTDESAAVLTEIIESDLNHFEWLTKHGIKASPEQNRVELALTTLLLKVKPIATKFLKRAADEQDGKIRESSGSGFWNKGARMQYSSSLRKIDELKERRTALIGTLRPLPN